MTKIYHFSGTGNSLWSAKEIARLIGTPCELYNIGSEAQKTQIIIIEAEAVIFVFPSYAYGLPLIVRRFVQKAEFRTQYIASFVTYGSSSGGTLAVMRRILKKKGTAKLFFGRIPAVENYLAIFGPPKEKKLRRRVLMQKKATEEAARAVLQRRENKVNTFRPLSSFIALLFSFGVKIFYKYYRVGSECNGCGACRKICPVCAIVMKNGQPQFTEKCEHCQGCVDMCPLRAIQFGRVKFNTPGYRHPEIDLIDLVR